MLRFMHACSTVLGWNRACISQGSLASLPRSPDFEPHRQKNALRAAAVRCAKRGRAAGRMRFCRRAGYGPGTSYDANCGTVSGRPAGRMRCFRRAGAASGLAAERMRCLKRSQMQMRTR